MTLQRWAGELRKFNPLFATDYVPKQYLPVLTADTGTLSGQTVRIGEYSQAPGSPYCEAWGEVLATLASGPATLITVSLPCPVRASNTGQVQQFPGAGNIFENGAAKAAVIALSSGSPVLNISNTTAGSNIANGTIVVSFYIKYPVE
jgi:hypothetical protein